MPGRGSAGVLPVVPGRARRLDRCLARPGIGRMPILAVRNIPRLRRVAPGSGDIRDPHSIKTRLLRRGRRHRHRLPSTGCVLPETGNGDEKFINYESNAALTRHD